MEAVSERKRREREGVRERGGEKDRINHCIKW